jgi:hypothetical protein
MNNEKDYSPEQLKEAETLAGLFFDEAEILIIVRTENAPNIETAMLKGRLMAEAQLRESIFIAAKNGSSPAQIEMLKLCKSQKIKKALNKIK